MKKPITFALESWEKLQVPADGETFGIEFSSVAHPGETATVHVRFSRTLARTEQWRPLTPEARLKECVAAGVVALGMAKFPFNEVPEVALTTNSGCANGPTEVGKRVRLEKGWSIAVDHEE